MALKDRLRKAWFQGTDEAPSAEAGGKVVENNPQRLGYPKEISYEKGPMATTAPGGKDSRPWEQQWFENNANDTKKVMGPIGEEFKLKQRMQRIPMDEKIANAKLSVEFSRTASPKSSFWSVYATDKKTAKKELILKATLEELWGEGLNEQTANDSATKQYGEEIIARLRSQGFARVAYLMTGNSSLLKKAQTNVPVPTNADAELEDVNQVVDDAADDAADKTEAADVEIQDAQKRLDDSLEKLTTVMQPEEVKEIATEIIGMQESLESLEDEGKAIAAALRDKTLSASARIHIIKLADEHFAQVADEALPSAENAEVLIGEEIKSLEEAVKNIEKIEQRVDQVVEENGDGNAAPAGINKAIPVAEDVLVEAPAQGEELEIAASSKKELTVAQIKNFLAKRAAAEEQKYNVIPAGGTKNGNDEINTAHPKGGLQTGTLVVGLPIKDNGARVETQIEQHEHDLKVADKMPTGELSNSISIASKKAGKITTASVDEATKKYYKDFYGQLGAEGKAFAEALVKDYQGQVKAAVEETEGRVKRAFELAEVASTKGMCEASTAGKIALFDKISKFDDNAFVAFKEAVEAMPVKRVFASEEPKLSVRTASKLPIVGQKENTVNESTEDFSALSNFGWSV